MKLDRSKTVFLCLHGPSLELLEDKLHVFSDCDVYWMTTSTIDPIQNMLDIIDKKVDIFYTTVPRMIQATARSISDFIQRDDTLLLSTTLGSLVINEALHDIGEDDHEWDYFWYSGDVPHPSLRLLACDYGGTFTSLFGALAILLSLGFKKIFLFGADGYIKNAGQRYFSKTEKFYQQDSIKHINHFSSTEAYGVGMMNNTMALNTTFWMMLDKWGITSWNKNFKIINVNPESRYSVFDKICISDLEQALTTTRF